MFGSHLSIAGGMHKALLRGRVARPRHRAGVHRATRRRGPPSRWPTTPWPPGRPSGTGSASGTSVSHDSYLINLASADDALWRKSIDRFVDELERCATLGIPYLVTHPGAHLGTGEDAGLNRVAAALDVVHDRVPAGRSPAWRSRPARARPWATGSNTWPRSWHG